MPISGYDLTSIIVPCTIFMIPITAIITSHQRKMAEIKARAGTAMDGGSVLNEIKSEMQALRREVTTLRDTTTTFDMSFDAAISRLEHRVDRVEENAKHTTSPLRAPLSAHTSDEQMVVGKKG